GPVPYFLKHLKLFASFFKDTLLFLIASFFIIPLSYKSIQSLFCLFLPGSGLFLLFSQHCLFRKILLQPFFLAGTMFFRFTYRMSQLLSPPGIPLLLSQILPLLFQLPAVIFIFFDADFHTGNGFFYIDLFSYSAQIFFFFLLPYTKDTAYLFLAG